MVGRTLVLGFLVIATVLLALAVLWDGSDRRSLTAFVAAGPMRAIELASVRRVEITKGDRTVRFERAGAAWRASQDATPAQLQSIDDGLTLLRNAAIERRFEGDERPDDGEAGLAPPQLVVRVQANAPFAIGFGGANPMGLARYARVDGDTATLLLPRYVADTWEAAAALREPPKDVRK